MKQRRPAWRVAVGVCGLTLALVHLPAAEAQLPAGGQYQLATGPCVGSAATTAACVFVKLKPTVQLKNLAPQVSKADVWCATKLAEPDTWAVSGGMNVTLVAGDANNWTPAGGAIYRIGIPKASVTPGQSFTVICELVVTRNFSNGTSIQRLAVASAATPLTPADDNWHIVAAGSTVKWTQTVTFPSATP